MTSPPLIERVTLSAGGTEIAVISLGARLQSVRVPDRHGAMDEVALGYDDPADYRDDPYYLGATIGRVANRIAGARFRLDGVDYRLPANNGPNSLHGGSVGFDQAVWQIMEVSEGANPSVTLSHVSPDGDQGYPGTLTTLATYQLSSDGALSITYMAHADCSTIVNLTNHSYWNLSGEGAARGAMGHDLAIYADAYLPVDGTSIPTGEIRPVAGTPFDFRRPQCVGSRLSHGTDQQIRIGRGYDHNWVIGRAPVSEPRLVARLADPGSGRRLELFSDQPGLQVYTTNYFDGSVMARGGRLLRQGDGIALEPQQFPDTPNQPAFGSVLLRPGGTYRHRMRYCFSAE